MKAPLSVRVQHLLPQRLLCAFIYAVSRCRVRWFSAPLISWFARTWNIDLGEAASSELSDYASLNDFFTRALRDGARTIDSAADAFVSPVDGTLTQATSIRGQQMIQAKGFEYSLADLTGEPVAALQDFVDGLTATIYLAPHDYHRIHVPTDCTLTSMRYIPGRRFAVNAATASWIDQLYCRNERLVCWFDAPFGRYCLVLVGALNVSSMSTTLTGELRSGQARIIEPEGVAEFARGEEFARFNLGSTVVLMLPPGCGEFAATPAPGDTVKLGQRLLRLHTTTSPA